MTRVAINTNGLADAEGVNGDQNRAAALGLLRRVPAESTILPAQTLGELFGVLTRKAGRNPAADREAVLAWQDAFDVAETSGAVVLDALELAADRQLGIWDAIILATAARAGCRLLLSDASHREQALGPRQAVPLRIAALLGRDFLEGVGARNTTVRTPVFSPSDRHKMPGCASGLPSVRGKGEKPQLSHFRPISRFPFRFGKRDGAHAATCRTASRACAGASPVRTTSPDATSSTTRWPRHSPCWARYWRSGGPSAAPPRR